MNETVKVEVTTADIAKARGARDKSCFSCPVANALLRITGMKWGVGHQAAHCRKYGTVDLPVHVKAWIARYDEHLPMRPVEFSLRVSERV